MARKNSNLISVGATLADETVTSSKIVDEAVSSSKIADEAVTSAKIDSSVASTGKAIAMAIVFGG